MELVAGRSRSKNGSRYSKPIAENTPLWAKRLQGLHRDLNSNAVPKHQLNRRRRVWGGVVTADRWYALSFGQPMTINLFDCDARGPSIYHDDYSGNLDQTEKPYSLHAEITKVSPQPF